MITLGALCLNDRFGCRGLLGTFGWSGRYGCRFRCVGYNARLSRFKYGFIHGSYRHSERWNAGVRRSAVEAVEAAEVLSRHTVVNQPENFYVTCRVGTPRSGTDPLLFSVSLFLEAIWSGCGVLFLIPT